MPTTRTGVAWWVLALAALALLIVLIFIVQNLTTVNASFLVASWRIPLGVDLLFAVLLGVVITVLLGSARMFQLRHLANRYARMQSRPRDREPSDAPGSSLR